MSRIYSALKNIPSWGHIPVQATEEYIRTGAETFLVQVKAARGQSRPWEGGLLAKALPDAGVWTVEDLRLVHVLHALGFLESLGQWLTDVLRKEKAGADTFGTLRAELESCKATTVEIASIVVFVQTLERDGKPNSAGQYLLSLNDADLASALEPTQDYYCFNLDLVNFIVDFATDRMGVVLSRILQERHPPLNASSAALIILNKKGSRFESDIHAFFLSMKDTYRRFYMAQAFYDYDAAKYGAEALAAARAALAGPPNTNNHGPIGEWMLEKYGAEVLNDMVGYLENKGENGTAHWKSAILKAAVARLSKDALPAVHALLRGDAPGNLRLEAVNLLITLNDGSQDSVIEAELATFLKGEPDARRQYQSTTPRTLATRAIGVAGRWKPARFAAELWKLFSHKSKPVRDAAARVLGQAGEGSIATAAKLLRDKKAATRLAAVLVLTTANTPAALQALEERLEDETDEAVRDAMLVGLEHAWAAQGRTVTRKEMEARIARVADKLTEKIVDWIDEGQLPKLTFKDGQPLRIDAVRYLLYRQSRAKEMRPDVEAKALYAMIDRGSSGDFALEILKGFMRSKMDPDDRWALTIAGMLGDDRVVPPLSQQIRDWADKARGKMAEYGVEALALLGTDSALVMVDALALRYRSKQKNVGRAAVEAFNAAAASLGMTADELGDRVVPWLGFAANQPRLIDCAGKAIEAQIGLDFKMKYVDRDKKKAIASLPKTAPKEIVAEFKELAATLREVSKAQMLRLENLMVRQYRWPIERWRKLFPVHPLLAPMAIRLVWGVYDDAGKLLATFRMLEDCSFTQASDEPLEVPVAGSIGIVHPLELSADERQAWQTHLADYEIESPFPQLERPVVRLSPDSSDKKTLREYSGINVNAMTFRGRAEKLGWARGSVCDGGGVTSYVKNFPAAGVDVFLGLEGMYIGIDMNSEIKLEDAFFAKAGSVKIGSYTYDEPSDEKDPRLLRFAEVPPIVYSEVLGDLGKISGRKEDAEE